jgi:hypothetical protein
MDGTFVVHKGHSARRGLFSRLGQFGSAVAGIGMLVHAASAADTLTTWQYSTTILLNTSSSGANVATTQKNFPVLVRLTSANAAALFASARSDGGDLRFSHAGDTGQLAYELNKYDAVNQRAVIWVKADSVKGNAAGQTIRMWWGKSSAATTSDSSKVFAPANGFSLVWHLNKTSGSGTAASPFAFGDATGRGNTGISTGTVDSPSVIDRGRAFNKVAPIGMDSIWVGDVLDSPAVATLSVWAKLDSVDQAAQQTTLISVGNNVVIQTNGSATTDSVHAAYHYATQWDAIDPSSSQGNGILNKGWCHVSYVVNPAGSMEQVYINGAPTSATGATADAIAYALVANLGPNTTLGINEGNGQTAERFFGTMCEARVEHVARSADWLRLCYENQQAADSLTIVVPAVPGAPTLALPSNGAVIPALAVTLSWNTVPLATTYSVQVWTDVTFGSTVYQQNGLTTTSLVVAGLTNSTTYYWRASAAASGAGTWSAVWTFTASISGVLAEGQASLKTHFSVSGGMLSYSLAGQGPVEISFSDLLGRTTPVVNRTLPAGSYVVDLKNFNLAAGRYLVRFKAQGIERRASVMITR